MVKSTVLFFLYVLHPVSGILDGNILSDELDRVANALGVKLIQDELDRIDYRTTSINGAEVTNDIAKSIGAKLTGMKNALRRIEKIVEDNYEKFTEENPMHSCCTDRKYQYDARFRRKISFDDTCVIIPTSATTNKKFPSPTEISSLLSVMKTNSVNNPNLLWQYIVLQSGVFINYPDTELTICDTFDPRYRPFYVSSVTPTPKDVVVVIDTSSSMDGEFLQAARQAVVTVLDTLDIQDRIGIVTFNDVVKTPTLSSENCFSDHLAVVTKTNKSFLKNFINSVSANGNSDYGKALRAAFRYFRVSEISDSRNIDLERIILFLTDGANSGEDPLEVIRDENHLLNNSVVIHTFGLGIGLTPRENTTLESMSRQTLNNNTFGDIRIGSYFYLKNVQNLAEVFGSYYTYTSIKMPDTLTFTTPYKNTFSDIGLIISTCLPLSSRGSFIGEVCTDIKLSELVSDITYLQEGEQTYAFIIDGNERTLVHPLLPDPRDLSASEYDVSNIYNLEPNSNVRSIINSMKLGGSGSQELTTKIVQSRGTRLQDGDSAKLTDAVYYWKSILESNFSLCVVIAKDSNQSYMVDQQSKENDFIYHRWDLTNWKTPYCKHYARFATAETTTVKLTPDAFANPYDYIDEKETESKVQKYTDYITGRMSTNPGLKLSAVNIIRATKVLEEFWKTSQSEARYLVWRYIMTESGVCRNFPGVRLQDDYDHRLRAWYKRTLSQKNTNVVSAPYIDSWGSGVLISLTRTIFKGKRSGTHTDDDLVEGVLGTDFSVFYFNQMLKDKYPVCKNASYSCMVMDNSGFLVMHPFFIETHGFSFNRPIHIANKEGRIARSLIAENILYRVPCLDVENKRKQYTYRVKLSEENKKGIDKMHQEEGYELRPVQKSNLFLILKKKKAGDDRLSCCNDQDAKKSPSSIPCSGAECYCLCYNAVSFNECENKYTVTEKQIPCSTNPPDLSTVSAPEKDKIVGLSNCFAYDCECRNSEQNCFRVSGCSWCKESGSGSLLLSGFCDNKDVCPTQRCETDDCKERCTKYPDETPTPSSNTTAMIIGICAGAVVLIVAVIIAFVVIWRKRRFDDPDGPYLDVIDDSCVTQRATDPYEKPNPVSHGHQQLNTYVGGSHPVIPQFDDEIS